MQKVVFFRVATPGDVKALLGGAQAKYPDLPEAGVFVTDDAHQLVTFALDVVGENRVRADGTVIVYDAQRSTETDIRVIDRCGTFGAVLTSIVDTFDADAGHGPEAIAEWVATGRFPASKSESAPPPVTSAFDDIFGSAGDDDPVVEASPAVDEESDFAALPEPEPSPAPEPEALASPPPPPPIPGDDDIFPVQSAPISNPEPEPAPPPPAPVEEPAASPAPAAEDGDDFWNQAVSNAPEPAKTPPVVDADEWASDVVGESPDQVFAGFGNEPAPEPVATAPSPAPAPAPAAEPSDVDFFNAVEPLAPTQPEPQAPQAAEVMRQQGSAMSPASPARSLSDDGDSFMAWAEQAEAAYPQAVVKEVPPPPPVPEEVQVAKRPEPPTDDGSIFATATTRQAIVEPVQPEAPAPQAATPRQSNAAGEREFATKAGIPRMALPGMRKGYSMLVTGSHGGCGKTTIAYLMPYVFAHLTRSLGKPVYLIEADYSNPKLAQRFGLPADQNSGAFANFVRSLSSGAAESMTAEQVQAETRRVIDEITYIDEGTGMRVIACPYDTTSRDSDSLRDAIQKLVNGLVAREDCFVFIDGQTFAKDDVLDTTLAATADSVILVGNARHVEDAQAFRHMLTTPVESKGAGVQAMRISLFLNRTSQTRAVELAHEFHPVPVVGYMPKMDQMDDSTDERSVAWVGQNLRGPELADAVTLTAQALGRVLPPEGNESVMAAIATLADRPLQGRYESSSDGRGKRPKRRFGRRS